MGGELELGFSLFGACDLRERGAEAAAAAATAAATADAIVVTGACGKGGMPSGNGNLPGAGGDPPC